MENIKCFACDRKLTKKAFHAHTLDGQQVLVGSECYKRMPLICYGDEHGYQPPKGGPRLFVTMLNPCKCNDEKAVTV